MNLLRADLLAGGAGGKKRNLGTSMVTDGVLRMGSGFLMASMASLKVIFFWAVFRDGARLLFGVLAV